MAGKTFINHTGYDLSIQLTVRKGDNPESVLNTVNFTLERDHPDYISYGDSDSPYLDGIAVNTVADGNIIAAQDFVFTRGSMVDNDFNTNDHVIFSLNGGSIVLTFNNG